ncbi:MAG: HlyD family efflux transporter periplasmic adaptor subunit [Ferruginibacter sp.]
MNISPISDNIILYKSEIACKTKSIYWLILLITITCVISFPFIKLNISVKSPGIIRPIDEKTEVRSSVSTVIDTIYFKEGDVVQKGDVIIQLRKENIAIKKTMNDFEVNQRSSYITDLLILTRSKEFTSAAISKIQSPVYIQQSSRFLFQLSELTAQLKKVNKELYMDSVLLVDRVIAPKEMFDKQIEHEKLVSNIKATTEQQRASWQLELARYQLEKSQFKNANKQLNEDNNFYFIKAPITGILQNFNKYYQGSLVQTGEALAVISPQAELIAECYINTRDVGLLKLNQPTLFQVDAFDYNYFGILTGKILSIDNDYTVIDNKPAFKVHCSLDSKQLNLKNGFSGEIKKGMTLQARFVVSKRSLWQLLFDKIDDWVNPDSPEKIIQ